VNLVWAVAIKEFRQISRDRRTMMVMLFLPAFFLLLYGYALNFDIRHVALVVQDRDETAESRRLVSRFVQSTYFDLVATAASDAQIERALDAGTARAALIIPEGFARDIKSGSTANVQVLLNGDNANTATTVLGYTTAVLREASVPASANVTARLAAVEPRIWYNPELRSTLFLVPGLIAYISMITAVVSTSLSIVREKENGTMEQIRMAPIPTPAFIAGKAAPYLLVSQISGILVILAAMALFGLPMRGNWLALSFVLAVFLIGAIGTGLLVSTFAETQQVAFQASSLIAFLPTFILSGFIFPIKSMPIFLQYVSTIVPARYFLIALRGIVLKGSDLWMVGPQVAALGVYAILVLGLASLRLAKR
jgi:ABC-2 type transport system permease protein